MKSKLLSQAVLVGLAVMAHEANRAYCASLGDDSVPAWPLASEGHKQSILAGVKMHVDNPDTTPEQAHASWLATKMAEGWQYGDTKDVDAKLHPCICPYAELPEQQRAKDWIFRGVVHAGLKVLEEVQARAVEVARAELQENLREFAGSMPLDLVRVTYVHHRSPWKDHVTGSGKEFETGKSYVLPVDMANKLLRLTGMFERTKKELPPEDVQTASATDDGQAAVQVPAGEGDAVASTTDDAPPTPDELEGVKQVLQAQQEQAAKQAEQDRELQNLNDIKLRIGMMDAEALRSFAFTNFQQRWPANMKEENMRTRLHQLIDQFGVAQ